MSRKMGHGPQACNGSETCIPGLVVGYGAGCRNKRVNRSAHNPGIITCISGQSGGVFEDGSRHTRVRSNGDILQLADGTVIPIRRRAAGDLTVVHTRKRIEVAPLPPKTNLVHVKGDSTIRCATLRSVLCMLRPPSKTIVKVVCGRTGPVVLGPRPQLYDKRQVSLTNGFADVQANKPFAMRVANFCARERTFTKNQVLGFANP